MDFSEIQELIRLFEETGLSEIEIEENGRRVRLAKQLLVETVAVPARAHSGASPAGRVPSGDAPADPETEALLAEGLTTIDSPMVGTFYASSSPTDPPFVQVGDTVDADQVVCIVEAMKIMNEVTAKVPAIVERVLVRNGAPVEYGQPLLAVRPLA
ncbi:MAG: acetyl-CoA carboxylase biotin carboxyl carrier protein [Candidatus Hydrogenedens sp.]|nr:acetyl-CoA carboxylase biotin carboxyl carrier protein [Candidatus Hydrogenedentota bacterium]NLF56165.1 acetyl-CoA carboxylase biotin carboxyl carrier protein [Candidatus Hydrogenedens sp.]